MRIVTLLGVLLGCCVGFSSAARATTVIRVDEATLLKQSSAVVLATVERIRTSSHPTTDALHTDIALRIDEVVSGHLQAGVVVVREMGGHLGDRTEWLFGSAEYVVGEQVLVFLERTRARRWRTANMAMGKFSIETTPSGARRATRRFGAGTTIYEPQTGAMMEEPTAESVDLDMLLARIRALDTEGGGAHGVADDDGPFEPDDDEATDGGTAAFTFMNPNAPARWYEPDDGLAVSYTIDATGDAKLGLAAARAAMSSAMSAWSDVASASLTLVDGGLAAPSPYAGCNGPSRIVFNDPYDEVTDPIGCSGILAIGGYCRSNTTRIVNGIAFYQIVVGKLMFNDGFEACTGWNSCAIAEVATHELGHTIGLGHSDDSTATMSATAHFDGRCAALRQDDRDAVSFIYPAPSGPSPTPTDTRTRTATPTATWTPLPTNSRTPTLTPSATATRSATASPTSSRTPSSTATRSATPLPSATATDTAVPPPTATPSATPTYSSTRTASSTRTPSSTATTTHTPLPSATATETRTPAPSLTPSVSPTWTATRTPTSSQTPSFTATTTSTRPPSATTTASLPPTPTFTHSSSPTRTSTRTPTNSRTPSFTATTTHSPQPSRTPTETEPPAPTATPSHTETPAPSATPTHTRAATPTASHTFTPLPTATRTDTPAPTTTRTGTATRTPTASRTATATRVPTATPTASATASATPTSSSTRTASRTPTTTATSSPTHTRTDTATSVPTATRSATSSATATRSATSSPSPTRTASPVATTTATLSRTPSSGPSATPQPSSTASASPTRTFSPAPSATATHSASPTDTATPMATATESPTRSPTPTATSSPPPTGEPTATATTPPSATSTVPLTPRNPPTTATPTARSTATPTAEERAELGGRIRYYGSLAAVEGATIASDEPIRASTTSGIDGTYRLAGLLPGTQELSVAKLGDHRGGLDTADAVAVLEAVSRVRTLDPIEQAACDVDGNRRLDRRDAEQILDVVLGTRERFDAAALCNSDWLFFAHPARAGVSPFARAALRNGCAARPATVDAVVGPQQQDFDAILLGDCKGDGGREAEAATLVTVDPRRAVVEPPRRTRTNRLRVPIIISGETGFTAAEIDLALDAARLQPLRVRTRHRSRHQVVRFGTDGVGTLTIAIASVAPQPAGEPLMLLLDLMPLDRRRARAQPPVVKQVRLSR